MNRAADITIRKIRHQLVAFAASNYVKMINVLAARTFLGRGDQRSGESALITPRDRRAPQVVGV